jgi:hypothetical protein
VAVTLRPTLGLPGVAFYMFAPSASDRIPRQNLTGAETNHIFLVYCCGLALVSLLHPELCFGSHSCHSGDQALVGDDPAGDLESQDVHHVSYPRGVFSGMDISSHH